MIQSVRTFNKHMIPPNTGKTLIVLRLNFCFASFSQRSEVWPKAIRSINVCSWHARNLFASLLILPHVQGKSFGEHPLWNCLVCRQFHTGLILLQQSYNLVAIVLCCLFLCVTWLSESEREKLLTKVNGGSKRDFVLNIPAGNGHIFLIF